jgi:hypothetical protein
MATIIKRSDQPAPLTIAQMDANFENINNGLPKSISFINDNGTDKVRLSLEGGTNLDADFSLSGDLSLSAIDVNTNTLTVKNFQSIDFEADSTDETILYNFKNQAASVDETNITTFSFYGKNQANSSLEYAKLRVRVDDNTTNSESASLHFDIRKSNGPSNSIVFPDILVLREDRAEVNGSFDVISSSSGALGSQINLYHKSASPANNDISGEINFYGSSRLGTTGADSRILSRVADVDTFTTEIEIHTANGQNTTANRMTISQDVIDCLVQVNSPNFNTTSDIREKSEIEKISNALDSVKSLTGYNFTLNSTQKRSSGVIAQEVEAVLPEVISENENGIKSVAYGNMVGLLIEAIKEQQNIIETLVQDIERLKDINR